MGAAAGHMSHVYENPSLTFKQIKDIFSKISDGKMFVTEKLDGTCLHLSYSVVDGKARAARNYKNISEGGVTLENVNLLTETTEVLPSFTEAIKIFESVINKIPIDEQIDIFGPNANYYYNCEIQDPNNPNVILYDRPIVSIHRSGHLKYNKFNKKITQETLAKEFIKLEKLLTTNNSLNEEMSDGFIVRTNPIRKLDELKDKTPFHNAVKTLQNEMKKYSVSEKDSLAEYILSRLDETISKEIPNIPKKSKIKLLERLMKAEGVHAKDVYESLNINNSPELIEVVRKIINSERKYLKEAISPIEEIVTEFGAGVLKEFKSSFIKDSNKETERLKSKLKEIFDIVGKTNIPEAQEYLNSQFKRIKDINNISLASEGFVFKYDDNIYKLTGMFSPLNQILGMMKFQRGNVPPLKTLSVVSENKTAVISWGRFNPPTIGHEIVFKFGNDLAKQNKADFFIVPTKTTDKQKNPLTIQEKITYLNKIFPEYTNNLINSSQINTIIEAAKYFSNKGYKNLKLVVGSDRKEQFEILNKYNNKEYNFNSIEIVSAGERLDEGEGAASMSASKMREAAIQGDIDAFMKGVAGRLDLEEGVQLMNLIRSRIEVTDGDKKKFLEPVSPSLLAEVIQKSGNKWCVFSKKKTKEGKRKKLGCYNSRTGAKKRLRQVEYFKSINEEQELEEMAAMSAGGVQGASGTKNNPWFQKKQIELEEDEVEEVYDMRPKGGFTYQSRFGSSMKRDDEPSRKEMIKILIMQEEQFMINRKEFVEEIKLRKIIREGLKRKMKEREEKILQEEKQLRLVIRKLLQEGEEDTPHPITGINVLKDLLKKIVPTIEKDYKNLTTDQGQRKSFRAHVIKAAKDLLHLTGSPDKAKEEEELQEEVVEDPNSPQDPKFIPIKKPQTVKAQPVDSFTIQGMDTTGRDIAQKTFDKIKKQIETSRSMLSNPKDIEAFEDYLLTNLKLHMDVFDNEMSPATEEPTTPEYEQEKQKLDSEEEIQPSETEEEPTAPEGDVSSQIPSSTPEQTPPASPNPLAERKKKK
jgi:nicotinic acid mononucleotide adenylyltransferase